MENKNSTEMKQQEARRILGLEEAYRKVQKTMADHGDKPIRASLSSSSVCTDATLEALNTLVGNNRASVGEWEVRFVLVDDASTDDADGCKSNDDNKVMFVEHPNPKAGKDWCNKMNLEVFPNQTGVMVGQHEDSAATALGMFYRFPAELYHFVKYVSDGAIFYENVTKKDWDVVEAKKKIGHYEVGYGREQFEVWMRRQIGRLNVN